MVTPEEYAKNPTEHAQQTALFMWAAIVIHQGIFPELACMFAIPNGGLRDKITAGNLKAEGVRSGVPDIYLAVARRGFHGYFIEMKEPGRRNHKKGGLSDDQELWRDRVRANDYCFDVCYTFEEARQALIWYLGKD